ncbi:Hypothetical predicted protein [Pelobates cultripes]|uniref:Uncharacterized protein n=1 Tax=Pelobates cultripes TaxID=61616 RepID=A0AAD1R6R9_PELCU|nr:Hypothetical predicted protein [Pelobates cultripes]
MTAGSIIVRSAAGLRPMLKTLLLLLVGKPFTYGSEETAKQKIFSQWFPSQGSCLNKNSTELQQ